MAAKPDVIHVEHDFGVPMVEGKDGYYGSFLQARAQFGALLLQSENPTDIRVSDFVDFIISGITDTEKQKAIWLEMDEEIKKIKGKDNIDTARLVRRYLIRKLGEVSAWYDRFVGVTVKNEAVFDLFSNIQLK